MTENVTRRGEEKLDALSMRKPSNSKGFENEARELNLAKGMRWEGVSSVR
jgi:hypothetical protein